MEICLIRHAEPEWMPGGRHRMDPELTDRGHRQASLLAVRAASWAPIDEVWVSPATRSQQTAAPLVERLQAPARTLDWLLEAQPPSIEGKTREEIRALFRGMRQRDPLAWWQGLPGGEDLRQFTRRVTEGLDQELAGLGGARQAADPHWRDIERERRVVIVSHAGTSGTALAHLMGLPEVAWSWERFRLGHAAMAVVRASAISEGAIFGLHSFNDRQHLPAELHTI